MVEDISGRYVVESLWEMRKVAQRVADAVEAGDILLLEGDLGAGKTAFVKALGLAFSVGQEVISPTFTVTAEYDVVNNHVLDQLVHVDLYRLGSAESGTIGSEEAHMVSELFLMAKQERRLVAVEWANKLPEELFDDIWVKRAWRLQFDYGQSEGERVVTIEKVDTSEMPPSVPEDGKGSRYPFV